MNWIHILHVLTVGWAHRHGYALWQFDIRHHAVQLLRSGRTSEFAATRSQALHLLRWLVTQHIAPVDW